MKNLYKMDSNEKAVYSREQVKMWKTLAYALKINNPGSNHFAVVYRDVRLIVYKGFDPDIGLAYYMVISSEMKGFDKVRFKGLKVNHVPGRDIFKLVEKVIQKMDKMVEMVESV